MKLIGASLVTLALIFSFVFFIIMLVTIYGGGIDLRLAIILTIIVNLLLWLVGPKVTDWINRWIYKVKFLSEAEVNQQYPKIGELITSIKNEYKFPFPKVGVIADNNPTAFTYGSARYNARLVVTEGIFKYLNEDEQKAVVAHELGHIVNRDFAVMMIASTMVQILYEIYAMLARRGRGDKRGNLAIIGLVSYILYWVGTYLLLFLSRTRETLADAFSAQKTEGEDLAIALVKIAYGIVTEADSNTAARLLSSTRHMGLVDVKDAKHAGSISYIAHNDRSVVAEAMLFDNYNPWAKVLELNSTHPLTGRRIERLSHIPSPSGRHFSFDVAAAAEKLGLDKGKLWSNFFKDLGIILLPFLLVVIFYLILPTTAILALGIGMILKTRYRYPATSASNSTVLDEMRNPYASPVRGHSIALEGHVVGRGVPGYIFGEDLMYQDKTGLIFLNYHSAWGFIGNLIFGYKKVKQLLGKPAAANGWFYRGMSSSLTLRRFESAEGVTKSYQHTWAFVLPVLVTVFGLIIFASVLIPA